MYPNSSSIAGDFDASILCVGKHLTKCSKKKGLQIRCSPSRISIKTIALFFEQNSRSRICFRKLPYFRLLRACAESWGQKVQAAFICAHLAWGANYLPIFAFSSPRRTTWTDVGSCDCVWRRFANKKRVREECLSFCRFFCRFFAPSGNKAAAPFLKMTKKMKEARN